MQGKLEDSNLPPLFIYPYPYLNIEYQICSCDVSTMQTPCYHRQFIWFQRGPKYHLCAYYDVRDSFIMQVLTEVYPFDVCIKGLAKTFPLTLCQVEIKLNLILHSYR